MSPVTNKSFGRNLDLKRLCAGTIFSGLLLSTLPAFGAVVFSESFEAPVVGGFDDNTVPSGGKWIGATQGFGATNRGLYNETVAWPATSPFTTAYGSQAYYLNYSNSGLTTSVGTTGQTLTADVTYKVSFNTAVTTGIATGNYRVELVAFGAADDNTARANAQILAGTILASATGTVTTTDMSGSTSFTFTPNVSNTHLGKDLGIRLIKSTNSVLYDNIRLVVGHDLNPTPASGVTIAGGTVPLSWTNMPAVIGNDVYVDVWFGTNPAALTKVLDGGLNNFSTNVSAPNANTYYWRVDSYLNGVHSGTPVTGDVFTFVITDTDLDGLPDTYELANTSPSSNTSLHPGDDLDSDGLTNLQEYYYGTGPNNPDTDGDSLLDGAELAGVALRPITNPLLADSDTDGLSDGVETNTGIWGGASNTGTNPVDADWDKDGLKDGVETKTGVFVSRTTSTGTDPYLADTDNDGAGDWYEVAATFTDPNSAAQTSPIPYPLPDPDGTQGASNKPVKVYIMAGQSNTVGIGYVTGTAPGSLETIAKREHKFPNLVTATNAWTTRNDVIYKGVVTATAAGPLTAGQGASSTQLGPELGFGQIMGWYHDEPVLIIKASQGNRSLGWDFLPPGSPSIDWTDGNTYAGFGQSPLKWLTGSTPVPINWHAGLQYDECFDAAHAILNNGVLQNLPTSGNNLNGRNYEIAGFVWWQGHKDQYEAAHYKRYETNLTNFIGALRTEFNAPNAPFVVGTIGFDGGNYVANTPYDYIYKAQLAVSDPVKHPEFVGTVKSVDTTNYWRTLAESPGNQGFHYNNNAETYMLVGDALGRAMLDLIEDNDAPAPNPPTFATAPTPVNSTSVGMVAITAIDVSGPVEYYFENITNGNIRNWSTSPAWNNTSLADGVTYDFRFKVRDSKGNETSWSSTTSGTPGSDVTGPAPTPMSFATPPTALGETSITMTATVASDVSGVEYYFHCTTPGGHDSAWQESPIYTDTGLSPSTSYTYQVRARDKSSGQNTTAYSDTAFATTVAPDSTPPTPSVMTFATPPTAQGQSSITMSATTASDVSGVEYYFDCLTLGGHDSDWQDSTTYTDSGLSPDTEYSYQVLARDKSPAHNTNTASAPASATTDAPDLTPPAILSLNPSDNATEIAVATNLVITFTEEITSDVGSITIKNLSDATETIIDINDAAQIIISGAVLTINPTTNLLSGKNFAVRIDATAFQDLAGNPFDGISDDTSWNFSTAVVPHVWTQTAGNAQDWTTGTNWLAGTFPNPIAGDTVDFSTVNIAANTTLTLGADRTGQVWKFGDTSGTQTWTVSNTSDHKIILAGTTPTIQVNNATTTLQNIVDGTAGLTKTGTGTLSLANTANTYSGGTTINGGNLTIAGNGSLGSGPVTVNANSTLNVPNNIVFNRDFILNNGASLAPSTTSAVVTVNGTVTGTGSIAPYNQSGASLTLANTANTFTGNFQLASGIQQGTIIVNSIGDGGIVNLGGTGYGQANFRYGTGAIFPLVLNTRQFRLGTAGGGKGVIQNDNTANSQANSITINTDLLAPNTGARTLELAGANTGANTFAGQIIDGSGTVSLNKAGTGNWSITHATNSFTGAITLNSTNTSAGTLSFASTAGSNPIAFLQTTGSATLRYIGSAPLTMSGLITASALTAGTITLDASGTFPEAAINYSNTSSLTAVATNNSVRKLNLSGTNTGKNSFAGVFTNNVGTSNAATLTKSGNGTWTLNGNNTYTGTTTVSSGKLFVNGDQTAANGAVSVAANATLGGKGTIGGAVTIAASGKLEFDLSTPAAGHDKLELAATKVLTFSGASTLTITSASGASPGVYTLVTAPGGITGVAPVTLVLPANWAGSVTKNGSNLELTITSVGTSFASWIATFPGVGGLTGFSEDADGDGIANGAENYFGTDPSASTAGMKSNSFNGTVFSFTHPQNANPSAGVTAAHSWSKNLTDYHAAGATDGDGTTVTFNTALDTPVVGTTTVTATVTGTSTTKLFVRISVTTP